jgi:MoxR-like ATPase
MGFPFNSWRVCCTITAFSPRECESTSAPCAIGDEAAMTTHSKQLSATNPDSASTVDSLDQAPHLLGAFPKFVALPIPRSGEVVGRTWLDNNGMVDAKVSREHISFTRPGGRLHLRDHGSQNGTFIDGIKLVANEPTPVDDGSIIRIGQTIFVYREAFNGPPKPQPPLGKLVGPWALRKIQRELSARVYRAGFNVLLEGAAGTGKELFAEEVARHFGRPQMVPINIAALPRESVEGNIFGQEKHDFTTDAGLLRFAAGGTAFLNDIDALPVDLHPKLLLFFEKRIVQPLGTRELLPPVDCLVIGATKRSVHELLTKDAFRRDLIARFQLRFTLPPLEDRPEDLFALLSARWEQLHGKLDLTVTRVDAAAIDRLMRHDWPENVRDLFRFVDTFDPNEGIKKSTVDRLLGPELDLGASPRSEPLTREAVEKALTDSGGNQTKAAMLLHVPRPQLRRWLRKVAKDRDA